MNTARNLTTSQMLVVLEEKDPTKTATLRKKFSADMTMRFLTLGASIRRAIVDLDVLGLRTRQPIVMADPDKAKFEYRSDAAKLDEFMKWLQQEEANGVLQVITGPDGAEEPWTNSYIQTSYKSGLLRAQAQLKKSGFDIPNPLPGPGGITAAFSMPIHADRAALIYTRVFTDLEGVTVKMNAEMRRVMAMGMAQGIGPEEMARRLTGKNQEPGSPLHAIGINRGRLIARTEMVHTHNLATLAEYQRASAIIGGEVKSRWITAHDDRVRATHAARDGKEYTFEEALPLLGEPNCRCALAPVVEV